MHIILGHTAYLEKKLGINVLVEISSQREEQIQQELGQSLEFLADRNTACGILTQILNGNSLHDYGKQAPDFLKVEFSTFITRSVVQAICILMHQFPYKLENKLEDTLVRTHPHPYIRMQWMNTDMGASVIGREKFTERIALPFAQATATLASNFVTPNSWITVNSENMGFLSDKMFSDFSYKKISQTAKTLQDEMWDLAPIYKGFMNGWKQN